jgi:glycosyltransferase involved in cell wall biosynthesis
MIKKLCIFTISFAFNRQVMIDFLEEIMPNEVELYLFVPKECKGKFTSKKIKIYESNYNKYSCFLDLRKFCKKNKINRIFSMGALPQEAYLMAFATLNTKTDFMPHLVVNPFNAFNPFNMGFNTSTLKALIEYFFLHPIPFLSKKFYVVSKDLTELTKKHFPLTRKKIKFLRYIVNTNTFKPKNKQKSRKKTKLPLKKNIILFVGRIENAKGSDIILKLAKINPQILFILIGQIFDKKIKSANLPNLKLLPPQKSRTKLSEYYNAADLFIFPSRTEGFPVVPREAMSCGTPCIVSNIIGLKMLKPAIKTTFKVRDINKKIHQFFELSNNKKSELSKESREFILNECSEEICKSLYINALINENEKKD